MMETFAFLCFYLFFLVSFFALYRITGLSLTYPSIPMALYWTYLISAYLGIPLLFLKLVPGFSDYGISDRSIIWDMLLCSALCLCLLLLGCSFARKVLKLCAKLQPISIIKSADVSIFVPTVLMLLSFTVFFLYASKLENLPITLIFRGLSGIESRIDATRFFPGKYHWYSLWFANILPFVSYYFFVIYLSVPKRKWLLCLFLLSFLFSSFALLCCLEKYPFLMYMVGIVFVYLIWTDKKVSKKILLTGFFGLIVFLFLTWTFFMGVGLENSPFFAVILGLGRMLVGQLVPLYMYFELVPDKIYYLFGQTFPNPMGILPFTPYDLPHEAMSYFEANYLGRVSYGGNMPTVFWGEIYANFSAPVALFVSFCMGILIYIIHFLITNGNKTPLRVALMAWMIVHFQKLALTGASFLITDIYLWGVLLSAYVIFQGQKGVKFFHDHRKHAI